MHLSIAILCFAVLVSDALGKIKLTREEEKKIVSEAEKEAGSAIAKLLQEKIGSKVLEAAREVKGILSKHLGKHIKTTASKILKNAKKKSKNIDDDSAKHIEKVSAFSSEETCTEQCRAKKLASKVKGVQPLLKKLKKMHKGASTSQTVHNTGSRLRKNDAKATHSTEGSEEVESKEESNEQTPQETLPSSGHQSAKSSETSNTEGRVQNEQTNKARPQMTIDAKFGFGLPPDKKSHKGKPTSAAISENTDPSASINKALEVNYNANSDADKKEAKSRQGKEADVNLNLASAFKEPEPKKTSIATRLGLDDSDNANPSPEQYHEEFGQTHLHGKDTSNVKTSKESESDDANFQDAVESIARQSIEKIFKHDPINNHASKDVDQSVKREYDQGKKHRKHPFKSSARHVHREEPTKAYSSEDQSLYEGNPYQDLYRHLPILPMVPVPLFYEGEDYSGDESEVASGDALPSDVKLQSAIKEDKENRGPSQADKQSSRQTYDEAKVNAFLRHKALHSRHRAHHKKQHVSNVGRTHSLNKEFHQALVSPLPLSSKFQSKKLPTSMKSFSAGVAGHGLSTSGQKTVKGFTQSSSLGPQGGIFSAQTAPSANGPQTLTLGQTGSNYGPFANQPQNLDFTSLQMQSQPVQGLQNTNELPINPLMPNPIQSNQLPNNQYTNNLFGLASTGTIGGMLPSYTGQQQQQQQQQDILSTGGLANSQPSSLFGSQGTDAFSEKQASGTCPPPCPAACAPRCSQTCCNADYTALASLLKASCSPSCAPLYSPSCCSSGQYPQQNSAQLQMPCPLSCAPQYQPSCCGSAPAPTFQIPQSIPQSLCPSICAPDYSASCCGSMSPPLMTGQTQQNFCPPSCAPQYLPSCCNSVGEPQQPQGMIPCSPSCAPSYLPSCCAAEVPQAAIPPSCSPSCAPQYTASCCSSNIGYGLQSVQSAPPPPPLQLRLGFKAGYLLPKPAQVPCPQSCSTQCLSTCPSNCCGVSKKNLIPSHALPMPQPSRPLALPALKPAAAKRVYPKVPVVKAPAPRQMPSKIPAAKPFPIKMSPNAPPNALNWDRR